MSRRDLDIADKISSVKEFSQFFRDNYRSGHRYDRKPIGKIKRHGAKKFLHNGRVYGGHLKRDNY